MNSGIVTSMTAFDGPDYPRGFLLAEEPVQVPEGYIPGPLLENFWVHPWTKVEFAGNERRFVVVVGHCLPTKRTLRFSPAKLLLKALKRSEEHFFAVLNSFGGRHAIIYGGAGITRILNDASAMRSVFYAAEKNVVGSHALLVEESVGGEITCDDLPFQYGYPGNRTPFSHTKILTANTYYCMRTRTVNRFWPRVPLLPLKLKTQLNTYWTHLWHLCERLQRTTRLGSR